MKGLAHLPFRYGGDISESQVIFSRLTSMLEIGSQKDFPGEKKISRHGVNDFRLLGYSAGRQSTIQP